MTKKYHHEPHFSNLLHLLMTMVQAQAGARIPAGFEWHNDRQTLAKKLAHHLATIRALGAGSVVEINGMRSQYVDHGSIKVLTRAVLENYIVFAFVFGDPDAEVSRFRHMTWNLGGLIDRQRRVALAISDESHEKLSEEREAVEELSKRIAQHPAFARHTVKERDAFLKGKWRAGRQWHELAAGVGLHKEYFRNVYAYLCDYSHSSYAAALQVGQAQSIEDQRAVSNAMFSMLNMVMAHFITVYATLFEPARKLFEESTAKQAVEQWRFTVDDLNRTYGAGLRSSTRKA